MMTNEGRYSIERFINNPIKQKANKYYFYGMIKDSFYEINLKDIGIEVVNYINNYKPETELQKNNVNAFVCSYIAMLMKEEAEDIKHVQGNSGYAMYKLYQKNKERQIEIINLLKLTKEHKDVFAISRYYIVDNLIKEKTFNDVFYKKCLEIYNDINIKKAVLKLQKYQLSDFDKKAKNLEKFYKIEEKNNPIKAELEKLLKEKDEEYKKSPSLLHR